MLQLSINSSSKSFPEESQLVKDLQLIEDELSGTDTLRLLFKARNESENQQDFSYNPLKTAKTIFGLKELQDWLFQVKDVTEISKIEGLRIDKMHSPVDVLEHYRRGLEKLSDKEVVQFFDKTAENGPKFLSDAEDVMQVTLRMRSSGSTAFLSLRDLLIQKVPQLLPHLKFSYTGGSVLSSESANNIAQGQINSVFLALDYSICHSVNALPFLEDGCYRLVSECDNNFDIFRFTWLAEYSNWSDYFSYCRNCTGNWS